MDLPDFLCIGAQKAGTSWLYEALAQHPRIWLAPIKELHFFDKNGDAPRFDIWINRKVDDLIRKGERLRQLIEQQDGDAHVLRPGQARKGRIADKEYTQYLRSLTAFDALSEDFYRGVFSWPVPSGTVKGEITPNYLEIGEKRVAHARRLLGKKKIIVLVRSPLKRDLSQLKMAYNRRWLSKGREANTLQEWIDVYDKLSSSVPRGSYSRGIPRWQKHFGKENVLVVPFGRIRSDPYALMRDVEHFLGVPAHEGYVALTEHVHKGKPVEIPEALIDRVKTRVAREDAYLLKTFGQAFFESTK